MIKLMSVLRTFQRPRGGVEGFYNSSMVSISRHPLYFYSPPALQENSIYVGMFCLEMKGPNLKHEQARLHSLPLPKRWPWSSSDDGGVWRWWPAPRRPGGDHAPFGVPPGEMSCVTLHLIWARNCGNSFVGRPSPSIIRYRPTRYLPASHLHATKVPRDGKD